MIRRNLVCLFLLLFSANLISHGQITSSSSKKYDLYLLIGQSNMAGRGEISEEDEIPLDSVYFLNEQLIWMKAADPIHFDKPSAGVGLAKSFGEEIHKNYPDKLIGLIPCAVGGTSISNWQPGVMHEQTISYPWDNMKERLAYALQYGELKGILWHQGEEDSCPDECFLYKERLIDLIKRLRELTDYENVPFVAGELGKFFVKENKKYFPDMKTCPASVIVKSTKDVIKDTPFSEFVVSNGLESDGGNYHFSSESYRELGIRYANMMVRAQNKY